MKTLISYADLTNMLHYNSDTGVFTWINCRSRRMKTGAVAGFMSYKGYLRIKIGKVNYAAHRLAWFYTYKKWPKDQIDHINGDRADNRLCNLREATNSDNSKNRKVYSTCSSGVTGVHYHSSKISGLPTSRSAKSANI